MVSDVRKPGYRPGPEEDPLNAWMWKCRIEERPKACWPARPSVTRITSRCRDAHELWLLRPRGLHP